MHSRQPLGGEKGMLVRDEIRSLTWLELCPLLPPIRAIDEDHRGKRCEIRGQTKNLQAIRCGCGRLVRAKYVSTETKSLLQSARGCNDAIGCKVQNPGASLLSCRLKNHVGHVFKVGFKPDVCGSREPIVIADWLGCILRSHLCPYEFELLDSPSHTDSIVPYPRLDIGVSNPHDVLTK